MALTDSVSRHLRVAASRDRSETQVRALAGAKVQAEKAYLASVQSPTEGLTDNQLADRAITIAKTCKAFQAAGAALHEAI